MRNEPPENNASDVQAVGHLHATASVQVLARQGLSAV